MFQSRTHNCGELRLSDAGKVVTLAGWLENVREVGANFAFLVLRDFYGTTQVVVETEEMMQKVKGINKESTVTVTGTVRVSGGALPVVSVRTAGEVPKERVLDVARALCRVQLTAPVAAGDVVIPNVLGTGVDVVATRSV